MILFCDTRITHEEERELRYEYDIDDVVVADPDKVNVRYVYELFDCICRPRLLFLFKCIEGEDAINTTYARLLLRLKKMTQGDIVVATWDGETHTKYSGMLANCSGYSSRMILTKTSSLVCAEIKNAHATTIRIDNAVAYKNPTPNSPGVLIGDFTNQMLYTLTAESSMFAGVKENWWLVLADIPQIEYAKSALPYFDAIMSHDSVKYADSSLNVYPLDIAQASLRSFAMPATKPARDCFVWLLRSEMERFFALMHNLKFDGPRVSGYVMVDRSAEDAMGEMCVELRNNGGPVFTPAPVDKIDDAAFYLKECKWSLVFGFVKRCKNLIFHCLTAGKPVFADAGVVPEYLYGDPCVSATNIASVSASEMLAMNTKATNLTASNALAATRAKYGIGPDAFNAILTANLANNFAMNNWQLSPADCVKEIEYDSISGATTVVSSWLYGRPRLRRHKDGN